MRSLIAAVIIALLAGCEGNIQRPEIEALVAACAPNGGLASLNADYFSNARHFAVCANGLIVGIEKHRNPHRTRDTEKKTKG